jgi:uroporphyrinogen decarboxylase
VNSKERYIKTLSGTEKPDRIFYRFGNPRTSTIEAWDLQGLPSFSTTTIHERAVGFQHWIGYDEMLNPLPVKTGMFPGYEIKIISEENGHQVWRDGKGITMEDAGDNLTTVGFKTRAYLDHPVKERSDWLEMKKHWNADDPERYREDWLEQAEILKKRTQPLYTCIPGIYSTLRDFVGFEQLSMMFYDNPTLIEEMIEHITEFIVTLLENTLSKVSYDCIQMHEDMAYKGALMISPDMFRKFMFKPYKKICAVLEKYEVPIKSVDSDGYVGELIPLIIEAGYNNTAPMEIAAGNDPVKYKKEYGNDISFWGGIDKRRITTKEEVYDEVMSKVPFLLETGGFIPGMDHAVPPTATLRGFIYMCELIQALAEGRPEPQPGDVSELEKQLGPLEKLWSVDLGIDEH